MKKLTWILAVLFVMSMTAILFAEAKMTMNEIKIDTPKKKSDEKDTKVTFTHKKHADEHSKSCDKCHPAIKLAPKDPANTKEVVHAVCKTCHDKDKPAKSFSCNNCHVPV